MPIDVCPLRSSRHDAGVARGLFTAHHVGSRHCNIKAGIGVARTNARASDSVASLVPSFSTIDRVSFRSQRVIRSARQSDGPANRERGHTFVAAKRPLRELHSQRFRVTPGESENLPIWPTPFGCRPKRGTSRARAFVIA